MATAPPILIWSPGGGVPVGPISNPPVYSQAGTTQLVEDQAYIDVVFGSTQSDDEWVLVECVVVNEIDPEPLNIWPGIITDKTTAGFRLQLNGMPDSGNYYLHWAVSGINIAPSPASTYLLSGPSSGDVDVASTFTVALPPSTTFSGSLTITPDDGGAGGVFSPTSVVLTTTSASATFTYTPASYGAITISVTNSSTLIDPAPLTFTCVAPTYSLSGPSTGGISVASTNFTVALSGSVVGTVTVTPSSGGGGGVFTPATVALTTGSPSATFTYTPASYGSKTISVTNDGGLSNPASISYNVFATTYTLAGPSSGNVSVASTNFTVALPVGGAVAGTVIVTMSDSGGGGTFTPTTLNLTTGSPSATFTYTPASAGTKTISVTNNGGLTNPSNLSYVASVPLTFLDNFSEGSPIDLRSHTADTGHTWDCMTASAPATNPTVFAGQCFQTVGASVTEWVSSYTPATADTEATITVVKGAITGAPEIGTWLRVQSSYTTSSGYMGRFVEGTGFQFYRMDPGASYVQIGSNVAGTLADGDTLRFTISGSGATVTLTLYKNGASVATAGDSSASRIVVTGKIGIHLHDPSAGVGDYRIDQISSP